MPNNNMITTKPLTFVTFYMDVTDQTMASIHQTTSTITVTEPHQYIQTMFASARRFHPDCRAIVLSDQATRFPSRADIDIIRYDLDPQQPMLSRSIAWLAYLRAARGHTVFLDSDLLINGDLAHVFAADFAVALTYRAGDSKWPINAGVNFAHGDNLPAAADFHELWLRKFRAAHLAQSVWGGDQDALREIFAAVNFAREDSFDWRLGELAIRFLPCARYNFSTSYKHKMNGYYPDALVLHFKGKRKPYMFPYWRAHIRPSGDEDSQL
ncbi:MAG: hypothetical protein F4X02_04280 [Chloroflexi bacterium]|nr:hypothetical protein [Chloroflexota bacterium]